MDAVITRIIETEKECALDIQKAEEASRQKIEAHRLALEKEKEQAFAAILSTQNNRLTQALESLNSQTEAALLTQGKAYDSRFQNPSAIETVKEKIIDILLSG